MGQKISPTSLRLNITENWRSRWFSLGQTRHLLKQDHLIREHIHKVHQKANILQVDIERFAEQVHIIIRTPRPGVLIGRGGAGIEELRKQLQKIAKLPAAPRITIPTEDLRSIGQSSQAVASGIAEQLERRMPYRRLLKQSIEQVMQAGVKGVKVQISGRLDGGDIARSETLQKGKLPLHTLRANIDYARATAHTTFGTVGVKVWVYKGDVLERSEKQEANNPEAAQNERLGQNKK